MIYVYRLFNQHNEVIYIGKTNNIQRRFSTHKRHLKKESKQTLYKICNKLNYTIERIEVLSSHTTEIEARLYEISYIIDYYLHTNHPLLNKMIDRLYLPNKSKK